MTGQRPSRRTYEESCEHLQKLGYLVQGNTPPVPGHLPQWDDEEPLGVGFFRTAVTQGDLGKRIALSDKQRQEIVWQESDGEEPPGG
jgi:hypothetical protein